MQHTYPTTEREHLELLNSTLTTVLEILRKMGIGDASQEAVIAAPPFYDGSVLLPDRARFSHFAGQIAANLRFVGYPLEEVAFLTVRQFCEMYVRDSFPEVPSVPLSDDQYRLGVEWASRGPAGDRKNFPICFVLGAPRSGTTLLRAMLNVHPGLWAPGELHLANFATMADRASDIGPVLRYMPIPEAALRCRGSIAAFSKIFRGWEVQATPVTDVFEYLHNMDPDAMIVDKSPPYCTQLEVLERIGEQFPNAKFVHLIRSPHDVIRSYVRMQLHRANRRLFAPGRNPYQIGEAIWFTCNSNAREFLRGIPAHRKRAVRYEDLVRDPGDSLRSVCELLERTFDARMVDPYSTSAGAIALGAGDPHINLLKRVEYRTPIDPFYELGSRSQELGKSYGY